MWVAQRWHAPSCRALYDVVTTQPFTGDSLPVKGRPRKRYTYREVDKGGAAEGSRPLRLAIMAVVPTGFEPPRLVVVAQVLVVYGLLRIGSSSPGSLLRARDIGIARA